MKLKKAIQNEIDTAFYYHKMVNLSDNTEIQNFYGAINAIIISAICSTVGLFGFGAAITLITGKSFLKSGLRQVIFGLAAAAVTFGIGHLIGVLITC